MKDLTVPEAVLSSLSVGSSRRPVFLHLLVADRCNHKCQHCYQVQGQKGEMSFDEIGEILRTFRKDGGLVVSISGGEATLRADLVEILEQARDLGLATILYTNAYLVDEALAARLASARVWSVDVSLYSDVPAEHDDVTQVPGSWERTVRGVRNLRRAGLNVRLKYTATLGSTATSDRLVSLAAELGCALFLADHVTAREGGRLEPTGFRQDPERTALQHPHEGRPAPLDSGPCGIGSSVTVRSDGVLQPCTHVAVELGRIGSSTRVVAERRAETEEFLRSLTWGHIHGCRDCDLRALCSRCYASAAAEVGDMLAPYRGACELAVARHAQRVGGQTILSPAPECGAERDPRVGPFQVEEGGALRPVPDVVSAEDDRSAVRFPWIRPGKAELEMASRGPRVAEKQKLIQLKRGPQRDSYPPPRSGVG